MIRIGHGYDVHQFIESDKKSIMLCGIEVPHTHAIKAHSDGDVAIHALVDAMLGAVACGDIGEHFPPSEAKWKDMDSVHFLIEANKIVMREGYKISNIDLTIVCEKPKLKDYKKIMRARLAEILEIDLDTVSVKATTTEKLGFLGRSEGIASHAVVCLYKF